MADAPKLQLIDAGRNVVGVLTDGQTLTLRAVMPPPPPVVIVPPPPPPALPPLRMMIADSGAAVRGEPLQLAGTAALADLHVEGYRQNITYMTGGGSLSLSNVRSLKAFREQSSERFQGQGLYFGNPNTTPPPPPEQWPGPATVRGCIFGWNGYRKMDGNCNGYRHGIYGGRYAGLLTVEDSIFIGNACAGVQVRRGGAIRRCVFLDNGIALLSVAGDVTFEDCVVFDGHNYAEVDGAGQIVSWTANNAVSNFTHLTISRCLFAGRPGQASDPTSLPREFDTGCIVNSKQYGPNPDWSPDGGRITASGNLIAGWPGKTFAGDRPHDGSGFIVKPNPVTYDPMPLVHDGIANRAKVADVAAALRVALWKAAQS